MSRTLSAARFGSDSGPIKPGFSGLNTRCGSAAMRFLPSPKGKRKRYANRRDTFD
jgi:hypothetical protein